MGILLKVVHANYQSIAGILLHPAPHSHAHYIPGCIPVNDQILDKGSKA